MWPSGGSETEGRLCEPAWPVDTALLSKAEAHSYSLIPWGVKLAAIVYIFANTMPFMFLHCL